MSSSLLAGRAAVPLDVEHESLPRLKNPAQQLWAEIKSWRRLLSRTHEFEKLADADLEESRRPGSALADSSSLFVPFSCFRCLYGYCVVSLLLRLVSRLALTSSSYLTLCICAVTVVKPLKLGVKVARVCDGVRRSRQASYLGQFSPTSPASSG